MKEWVRFVTLAAFGFANQLPAFAAPQSIAFPPIPNQFLGSAPVTVTAKSSSGTPVTFTSTTPAVCKAAGNMVVLLSAGPCFITASGTESSVSRNFTVSAAKPSGSLLAAAGGPVAVGAHPLSLVSADFNGDGIVDIATANYEGTVSVLLGSASGGFTAAGAVDAGSLVESIVAGDFNGDEIPDLATANAGNSVSVLLGNGAGGFVAAAGSPFRTGSGPKSIAVGDFNGDGIEDLATANFTGKSVTVLIGNGAGGFSEATGSPFGAGAGASAVVAGDFNTDGVEDLAVANSTDGTVTVLLGNRAGGFTAAPGGPAAVGMLPQSIVLSDFNRDGISDLATANRGSGTVTVLLGNGSGGFVSAPGSPVVAGLSLQTVAAGDLNGDGIADLVTSNSVNGVSVFLGDGSGGFSAAHVFDTGTPSVFSILADLNGDGVQDLAAANYVSSGVTVLLGGRAVTTAVLSASSSHAVAGEPVSLTLAVSSGASFGAPSGIATFFDGVVTLGTAGQDGSPYSFNAGGLGAGAHVLTARYSGDARNSGSVSVPITIQVDGARLAPRTTILPTLTSVTPSTVPVLSAAKLVTIVGTNFLTAGVTKIQFTPPVGTGPVPSASLTTITPSAGQITAAQILATIPSTFLTTAGTATVKLSNGVTAFSPQLSFTISSLSQAVTFNPIPKQIFGVSPFSITALPNGPGSPFSLTSTTTGVCKLTGVLVTLVTPGTCTITASRAGTDTYGATSVPQSFQVIKAPTSGAFTQSTISAAPNANALAMGDFNGDGFQDLAAVNSSANTVTIMTGNGAGVFTAVGSPIAVGATPSAIVTGDFNLDGKVDLAITNFVGGNVSVLLGTGSATFTSPPGSPFLVGGGPGSLAVGDFNGDGIQDLIVTNSAYNTLTLLTGNGLGVFAEQVGSPIAVSGSPNSVAVGNLNTNADNTLDVVVGTSTGYSVFVGNGSGGFSPGPSSPVAVSGGVSGVAVGIISADTNQDIVYATFSGNVQVFAGNGSGAFANALSSLIPVRSPAGAASAENVVLGDFNGDTFPDFAVANTGTGNVSVYTGNNLGNSFTARTGSPYPLTTGTPGSIVIGDVNGDGIEDLVVGKSGGAPNLLTGIAIGSTAQTITFGALTNVGVTVTAFAISATASSALSVSFGSTTPSICTVSGSAVTVLALGTCTIVASQPGNGTFAPAANVSRSFTVTLGAQTILFNPLGNVFFDAPSFTVSATASSALPVTFSTATPFVCTVTLKTVAIVAPGTCLVVANQAGNGTYAAAPAVTQSFSVYGNTTCSAASPGAAFIRAEGSSEQLGNLVVNCVGGGGAGILNLTVNLLPSVTISSVTVGTGGSAVSETIAGINATSSIFAGGAVHGVVSGGTVSFSGIPITSGGPFTVTIANLRVNPSTLGAGNIPVPVSASIAVGGTRVAGATLPTTTVAWAINGLSGVMASDAVVNGVCAATTADTPAFNVKFGESFRNAFKVQGNAGNLALGAAFASGWESGYGVTVGAASNAAASGTRVKIAFHNIPAGVTLYVPLTVVSNGAVMTLTVSGNGAFSAAVASTDSGAPSNSAAVAVSSGNGVVVYEETSTAINAIENYTVPVYLVAPEKVVTPSATPITATVSLAPLTAAGVNPSFADGSTVTVNGSTYAACGEAPQTISFTALPTTSLTTGVVTLAASASPSNLPVNFVSDSAAVCTVSGNVVTLKGAGSCAIRARQPGNLFFAAAADVVRAFTVTKGSQTITFTAPTVTLPPAPVELVATASSNLPVTFLSTTTSVCTVSGSTLAAVTTGTCAITASQAGDVNYLAAPNVIQSFTIAKGSQLITFAAPNPITLPASPFALTATTTSGLTVTFTSTTTSVCTVAAATVTPLSAGTCSITAAQAGNANYLAATSVTRSFTINPAPVVNPPDDGGGGSGGGGGGGGGGGVCSPLLAIPDGLVIEPVTGGAPATKTVKITCQSSIPSEFLFSTGFKVSQGSGWLSISPASGTLVQESINGSAFIYSATFTVKTDPGSVPADREFTGTVSVSTGGAIVTIAVKMKVVASAPKFAVGPQSLNFSYRQGSATTPVAQGISVFSVPSGLSYTATASSTGNWLVVEAGGKTPGAVAVSVKTTGLAPGSYSGNVAIVSGSVNVTVPVTLTIIQSNPPALSVSPGTMTLTLAQDAAAAGALATVSNTGGGTLAFTATSDTSWLKLGSSSGSALAGSPVSLGFTADPSGLQAGTYTGHITVRDSGSSTQSVVNVVLTVTKSAAPAIQLSKAGVSLTGVIGGAAPQSQVVSVYNSGSGTLSWTTQTSTITGGNWLTATSNATSISVGANTAGLAAGQYYGAVNVTAPNAVNNPQTISVVLNVVAAEASPGVSVSTGGVLLVGTTGGAAVSQNVTLYNASSTAIAYSASLVPSNGWLSVSPSNGSANAGSNTIQISGDMSALAAGVQQGSVTLGFENGSTAAINVIALVLPKGVTGSARGGLQPLTTVACSGSKAAYLIPIFRSPANQASLRAGTAVTLQAQVIDDCGRAVTAAGGGSVQVTFSNGDAGINLNDVGAGVWEATWVPATAGTSVALNVAASSNGLAGSAALSALSTVSVTVNPAAANAAPQPTGIANAASAGQAIPGVVAPGSYIAIYGAGLAGTGNPSATSIPLPTTLNDTKMFLGGLPMPLLYAGAGQVNGVVPSGLAPNASYPLVVVRGNSQSVPVSLTVTQLQPGAYTVNTSGSGAGIVTNALTGALISASNPAHAGDFLVIYGTGLGTVAGPNGEPQPADGAAPSGDVVYRTKADVSVTIGGVKTPALFAGLTPGLAALYQVNIQVPDGVAAGGAVPLVITATDPVTGATGIGNTVAITVR